MKLKSTSNEVVLALGGKRLRPIKDALPDDISYSAI